MKSFNLKNISFLDIIKDNKTRIIMSIAKITRKFVETIEERKIFTYQDIPSSKKSSIAIELSRLVKKGVIKRVSKGRFYKPKIRAFGEIAPSISEKISNYLALSKEDSYETGYHSYRRLGLTTQVANVIVIASDIASKSVKLGEVNIKFVPKRVKDIPQEDIVLLQILDALQDIKKIPDTTPTKALGILKKIIEELDREKQQKLALYAKNYAPRTKVLVGAIIKEIGLWEEAYSLKDTLNPLTTYRLNISSDVLPNKKEWKIV
jgi:predicted transcriptional regulator of viral defense system